MWDLNLEAIVKVKFDIDENGKIDNIKPNANLVGVSFMQQRAFNNAKQVFEIAALQIMEKLPLLIPAKVDNIPTKKTFQIFLQKKYFIKKNLHQHNFHTSAFISYPSSPQSQPLSTLKKIES